MLAFSVVLLALVAMPVVWVVQASPVAGSYPTCSSAVDASAAARSIRAALAVGLLGLIRVDGVLRLRRGLRFSDIGWGGEECPGGEGSFVPSEGVVVGGGGECSVVGERSVMLSDGIVVGRGGERSGGEMSVA